MLALIVAAMLLVALLRTERLIAARFRRISGRQLELSSRPARLALSGGVTVAAAYSAATWIMLMRVPSTLAWFLGAGLILLATMLIDRSAIPAVGVAEFSAPLQTWELAALLVPIAYLGIAAARELSVLGDTGWDAHMYHIVMVGNFVGTDSFLGWPDLSRWQNYPSLTEGVGALIASATGRVRMASVTQYFFGVGVICLAHGMVRAKSRAWAVASMVVIGTIPTFLFQTRTLYSDVTVAFFFACGLIMVRHLLVARTDGQPPSVIEAAVLGLVLGAIPATKFLGASVVPLFLAAVFALRGPWRNGSRKILGIGGVVVLCAGFTAAPVYVRNAVQLGNIAAPFPPSISEIRADSKFITINQRYREWRNHSFADVLTESYVTSPLRGARLAAQRIVGAGPLPPIQERFLAESYYHGGRVGGFGVVWLLVVSLAALVGLIELLRKLWNRNHHAGCMTRNLEDVATIAVATLVILTTPASWWPRFTLSAGIGFAVVSCRILARIRGGAGRALTAAVVVGALGSGGVAEAIHLDTFGSTNAVQKRRIFDYYAPTVNAAIPLSIVVIGAQIRFPASLWGERLQNQVDVLRSRDGRPNSVRRQLRNFPGLEDADRLVVPDRFGAEIRIERGNRSVCFVRVLRSAGRITRENQRIAFFSRLECDPIKNVW